MNNVESKKILVAIDGSEYSSAAVHYASAMLNPKTTHVVLLHALRKIDDAFWNIGMKRAVWERMVDIKGWEAAQDEAVQKIMDESRQAFLERGYPKDAVKEVIHRCKEGVAREIVEESKGDYHTVFLGRKGVSAIKDLVMGGTAQKLIERTTHIPACVVGKQVRAGNLLVALDSSEGAMRAVEHVGLMFGDTEIEVTLIHVIRDVASFVPSYGMTYPGPITTSPEDLVEEEKREMHHVFEEAKSKLIAAGMDEKKISWRVITDVSSRANVMIREAQKTGHGGVVIGRRGLSKLDEFFMGSMSNKVVHLGKNTAVWVVS
jgi:nucleotide-binding universal stress UspA family protein